MTRRPGPMACRALTGAAVAFTLWWGLPAVAGAAGHCARDFVLDHHACEVAHHGPLVAIFGGAAGLVALVGSGLLDGAGGASTSSLTRREATGQRARDEEAEEGPSVEPSQVEPPPPEPPQAGPSTLNTQEDRVPAVTEPAPLARDGDGRRSAVQPLDPGLPDLDPLPETPVEPRLPQDIIDRWTILGADGGGRIVDHTGQHILTIHPDGSVTDLSGNPIQSIAGDGPLVTFVDGQGRVIEYDAAGRPVQRVSDGHGGTIFQPVDDLAPSVDMRPDLDPGVAARWTGAGAGPDGELYGANGAVIGRIDPDGNMRTLDGREITGFTGEAGRITEFTTGDGAWTRTAGATTSSATTAGPGVVPVGDDDLAALVRQTETAQAVQGAETRVQGPGTPAAADPVTRAGSDAPPSSSEALTTPPVPPETPEPPRAPDGPRDVDAPPAPSEPAPAGGPRAPDGDQPRTINTPDGPRGAGLLGNVIDLQGAIDQVQREVAEGRSTGEALTRATAMTWAGNAIGDGVNTNIGWGNGWEAGRVTDVRVTLIGSSMLPEGLNNLLPDQMAGNTIGTGMDAIVALTEDAASSLGGSELDTSHLDEFTQRLAARPGVDPWAGYARAGELLGEELGNADGDALQAVANLGSEAWTLREDIAAEVGESITEFSESAAQGRHGSILQGYAGLAQAAGDPPDPAQFAEDFQTLVRVAWDDATGSGDTGGFGGGFWQEQADHANQTIRGVPIAGTVFDGYAQVASGIEEQGVGGFATEMYEGAAALGNETYEYMRSWF